MVRVVFLRRIGISCLISCSVKRLISSEFDGTSSSLYLAAALILSRFKSSRVACGLSFRMLMISRKAKSLSVKVKGTKIWLSQRINKVH